jgi:predicted ATPase
MEIKNIEVENFKCFEKIDFSTSKLTLLTGANSSGKSSLLYTLLGSIQSGEFPFQLSPNGKYVRMGDFYDIVYNHELGKRIRFKFETISNDLQTSFDTYWDVNEQNKLPKLVKLIVNSNYFDLVIEKVRKYHLTFNYRKENDPLQSLNSPELMKKILGSIDSVFREARKNIKEDSSVSQEDQMKKVIDKYSDIRDKIHFTFSDINEIEDCIKNDGNYWLEHTYSNIKSTFQRFDETINFISSFRLYPERTYYEKSQKDLKVGRFGENYEDQIIYWESKKSPEYKELIEIMKELNLFEEIKTRRLEGGRYELLIKNKKGGVYASLSDVGFGISQFLPIIVADLQLKKSSTLFIAQPEIHLHPQVQAQFAEYLSNRIKNSSKNYIIETHSEYLINRIRLLVVKGELAENDISVIYLENNGKDVMKYNLKFTKSGKIENAPKSFFETYMLDSMEIALNAE